MTDLEIYLHGTLTNIKDVLMAKGLASEEEFLIAKFCDNAHREFLKRLGDEIKKEAPAPTGPGGIHLD